MIDTKKAYSIKHVNFSSSVRNGGDLHNGHDDAENFLEALSSKSLATEMFNPVCDYLKKLDSSWEFTNPSPVNRLEKHLNSYNSGTMIEPERMTNLSALVSNWSIAPPNTTHNVPLNPAMPHYSSSNMSPIKPEIPNSPSYPGSRSTGYLPNSYVHGIKGESQHQDLIGGPFSSGDVGSYQVGLNNPMIGLTNKYCNGISSDVPWSNNARNLSDLISFGSCLNKPVTAFHDISRPSVLKGSALLCDSKKQGYKQGYETSSSVSSRN